MTEADAHNAAGPHSGPAVCNVSEADVGEVRFDTGGRVVYAAGV